MNQIYEERTLVECHACVWHVSDKYYLDRMGCVGHAKLRPNFYCYFYIWTYLRSAKDTRVYGLDSHDGNACLWIGHALGRGSVFNRVITALFEV